MHTHIHRHKYTQTHTHINTHRHKCTHTQWHQSTLEKEGNSAIYDNMDKPEDIMQSEVTWTQRDKYCMILLIWNLKNSQPYRNRVEWWLPGCRGWGNEGVAFRRASACSRSGVRDRRATPCLQRTALHCALEDCSEGWAHVKCSYHNKALK